MNKKWMVIGLLVLVLSGCASTVRVGWFGSNVNESMTFRYGYFDGVEEKSVTLDSADPLTLNYDVTVDAGSLTLQIVGPDETAVWEQTFTVSAADSVTVPLSETGRYRISALGEDASGEFSLRWTQ